MDTRHDLKRRRGEDEPSDSARQGAPLQASGIDRKRRHTSRNPSLNTLSGLEAALRDFVLSQSHYGQTVRKTAIAILPSARDGAPYPIGEVIAGLARVGMPVNQDDAARLALLLAADSGTITLKRLTASLSAIAASTSAQASWPYTQEYAAAAAGAAASSGSGAARRAREGFPQSRDASGQEADEPFRSDAGMPEFGTPSRKDGSSGGGRGEEVHGTGSPPRGAAEVALAAELRAKEALREIKEARRQAEEGFQGDESFGYDPASAYRGKRQRRRRRRVAGAGGAAEGEVPPGAGIGAAPDGSAGPAPISSGLLHKRRAADVDRLAAEDASGSDGGAWTDGDEGHSSGAELPFGGGAPTMMRQTSEDEVVESLRQRRRVQGDVDVGAVTSRVRTRRAQRYVDAFDGHAAQQQGAGDGSGAPAPAGGSASGASAGGDNAAGPVARHGRRPVPGRRRRTAAGAGAHEAPRASYGHGPAAAAASSASTGRPYSEQSRWSAGRPPRARRPVGGRKLSAEAVHALLGARHLGVEAATRAAAEAEVAAQLGGSAARPASATGSRPPSGASSGAETSGAEGEGAAGSSSGGWSATGLDAAGAFRVVATGLLALGELLREGRLGLPERVAAKELLFSGEENVVALVLRFLQTAALRQAQSARAGVRQARDGAGRTAEENALLDVLERVAQLAARERAVPVQSDPSAALRGVMPEDDAEDEEGAGAGGTELRPSEARRFASSEAVEVDFEVSMAPPSPDLRGQADPMGGPPPGGSSGSRWGSSVGATGGQGGQSGPARPYSEV